MSSPLQTFIETHLPWEGINGPVLCGFFDDFDGLNVSATSGAADWYVYQTGGSGAAYALDTTRAGGVLKLTQSSTDNDVLQFIRQCGIKTADLKAGDEVLFGCRVEMPATPADMDVFIGLFGSPSGTHDNDLVGGYVDGVGVKIAEGSAAMSLVCHKDSASDSSVSIGTAVASTFARFDFKWVPNPTNKDSGQLHWRVNTNDIETSGQLAIVDNWPDDEVLFFNLFWQAGNTSAEIIRADWAYCFGRRAAFTSGAG